MNHSTRALLLAAAVAALAAPPLAARAQTADAAGPRLKDIAVIQGVRGNQLVGYGLVVGLNGTGDSQQVSFTSQSTASLLQKFGVNVGTTAIRLKNVAAVLVTADLPAFAKDGGTIDVTVSSLGDASSLQGGTLIQTPLVAANGQTYAVAQGSVSIGGFAAGGGSGGTGGAGSVTENHPTAGRVPGGAIVEQNVPTTLLNGGEGGVAVTLSDPDFTTAARIVNAINAHHPYGILGARAADAATIDVAVSPSADPVAAIAALEEMNVTTDTPARIVINERTGTVVLGGDVTVSACAIAHGNLTVEVTDDTAVSQPVAPFTNGATVAVPRQQVNVQQTRERLVPIPDSPTISKVVKALNALGVTPLDLIAILQAMKQAGALHADLEIQ